MSTLTKSCFARSLYCSFTFAASTSDAAISFASSPDRLNDVTVARMDLLVSGFRSRMSDDAFSAICSLSESINCAILPAARRESIAMTFDSAIDSS